MVGSRDGLEAVGMKANRSPRQRAHRRGRHGRGEPDGGAMLLLAGFLLAGAVLIAMGTYSVLQRTETGVIDAQDSRMADLFLNTRTRAIDYFSVVSAFDTNSSLERALDNYLAGQYHTARTLGMDLNASLAGSGSDAPLRYQESAHLDPGPCDASADCYMALEPDPPTDTDGLWSHNGAEAYSCVEDDGRNDGLITDGNGKIYAALLWIRILSSDGDMEEVVVIDVPATSPPQPSGGVCP